MPASVAVKVHISVPFPVGLPPPRRSAPSPVGLPLPRRSAPPRRSVSFVAGSAVHSGRRENWIYTGAPVHTNNLNQSDMFDSNLRHHKVTILLNDIDCDVGVANNLWHVKRDV